MSDEKKITYFIDLDGTVFYFHEPKFLPGAEKMLKARFKAGHRIIFITGTGKDDEGEEWSLSNRKTLLDTLKIEYMLIGDCPVPRVIIDDNDAFTVKRDTNQEW
jgi:hypothetical protein